MKQFKPLLFCLLVCVLTISMIPGLAFGDGPWDINYGGGNQTNGGGTVQDRDAVVNGSGGVPGEEGDSAPDFVSVVTSHLLFKLGFVNLSESIIVQEFETRVNQKKRVISSIRK